MTQLSALRRGAIGAVAAGAALALTACGGPGPTAGDRGSTAPEIVDATPAAAGDIDAVSWAIPTEPASLDWIVNADNSTSMVTSNVCEGLFRMAPDMTLEPALAESVDAPDDTTRVFTLRSDATFHDGTPLTADDVVFSLDRIRDPESGSFWTWPFANVSDISATGPLEVTIEFSRPDALFESFLASPVGVIESRATVEKLGDAYGTPQGGVNCIGPFSLDAWEAGQSITLRRDEGYYDERYRAKSETFEFQFVRDPSAIVNGLLSGSIDGTWDLAPSAVKRLGSSGAGTVYFGQSRQGYNAIVLDPEGPLADPIVRRAVSRAIDREAIIAAAVGGAADEQRAPAVPGTWGYERQKFEEAWDGIEFGRTDLDAAKQLLESTDEPTEPIVIASTTAEASTPTIAAEIQSALTELGLEAEIRNIPADQYYAVYTDPEARAGIDLYLTAWGTDFADPTQIYQYFTTGNIYNFTGYSNPELDDLVAKAAASSDLTDRADAIIAAQEIVVDESLWIPIYAPYNTLFLGKRVTGAPTSYVQLLHPWAASIGASA